MILRGSREDHLRFLLHWFENLSGASLHVAVGEFNPRIHKAGTETVEVRMPKHASGRQGMLIGLLVCNGQAVELTYFVPCYRPMLERALVRLIETFG